MEDNLLVALKTIPNNNTPGNDDLSKEFYETFYEEIKDVFTENRRQHKYFTNTSCYKAFRKKYRDKRYIKIRGLFFTKFLYKNII